MSDDQPHIEGPLEAAEAAAERKGSRVYSVAAESSTRVVVEVVRGPGLRALLYALLAAAILAGGFRVNSILKERRQKPERRSTPQKPKVVEAIQVQPGSYQVEISALASAKPYRSLVVASQVSGRVKAVHPALRPGGFVKEGDILFELDDADLKNTLRRLEAQLSQGKARRRSLQAQLTGATKALANARKALTLTKEQLKREERLLEKGHSTAARVDQAKLSVNTQRERVDSAVTNKAVLPGQIAQASAEIDATKASLAQTRLELSRVSIKAGFDAQVRRGNLEGGSLVQAGQAIATLEATDALEVAASFPVDEALRLAPNSAKPPQTRAEWSTLLVGRNAIVSRDTVTGDAYRWNGVVSRLGPGLDERTRMLTLFVTVQTSLGGADDGTPLPLLPDMFCNVQIPGRTLADVVVIPRKALQKANEVYLVAGADEAQTLKRQRVEVAMIRGDDAIISSGLEAGDLVITTALPKAVAGMPLALRNTGPKPGVASR